ncbi:MAG: type IX secretion system sortase PorU [Flavobacteriales bacterium]|nr:type IX secretion system sortase PorU [Flavobacteriales bacterium]
MALIEVLPFRRDPVSGNLQRLLSFTLSVQAGKGASVGRPKSGAYPDQSKLASGDWYRISVPREGVYRITGSFLQQLGVNLAGLSPDQLNIYGKQSGQLPYRNADLPATDLTAHAIQVNDGGDGTFDANDELLFYAGGPDRWELRPNGLFTHVKNAYCDSAYYFIGIGTDPPKRVQDVAQSTAPVTHTVATFNERQVINREIINLVKSGRQFFGESYDIVKQYNYSFAVPFLSCEAPVTLVMDVAARTIGSAQSSFTYNVASGLVTTTASINGIGTSYTGYYARPRRDSLLVNCPPATIPITVTFNPADPVTSIGYMNSIEMNARRELRFVGDQLSFRDVASAGPGNVAQFDLGNAGQVHRIWDLTDPLNVRNVPFTDGGNTKTFRLNTDSLRQFIAFRNTNYLVPTAVGRVSNQDLHATALPTDLVIVCPPEFQSQATRLASQRANEGLSVVIVSPQQVYNEFSSGTRDATAIKYYMKMLYDKAGSDPALMPRYLLLFGDGSYNNYATSLSNQNYIPTYQSFESLDLSRSYTSDDYFGLLDDGEGEATSDLVDIGIGRLPVVSLIQASQAVDKILRYDRLTLLSTPDQTCASGGDGGANDWRTLALFVSDDMDGDNFEGPIHMLQSDQLATRVDNEHPEYNVAKIYLDAYRQITNLGVERYPEAEEELKQRVQKGALLVNYIGHGGEVGWAHERLLNNSTILGWTNSDRLPLFMTATCEFTRWDDPARTSAGEYVFLNPSGGGIALMTTTRLAYSFQNFTLAGKFYDHVFDDLEEQGRIARLGDVYRRTKIDITLAQGSQTNHRSFTLIGDPSTRLAQPRQQVVITSVTDTLGNPIDTLKALGVVRITGQVLAADGTLDSGFNGVVIPTVFDKRVTQSTLANDGGSPFNYSVRKNVIYKGKASAVNGLFTLTFVVPKDIAYQVGPGRVSVYAEGLVSNALGYSNDILVGDTDPNAAIDEQGPRIDLYLNDERFVHGGITNETPMIFAKLFDVNGINTVGNSIGHDLLAIVDENTDRALVLNDYYESDLDTYQSGKVRYRLSKLEEGSHTLSLKAWDVHNNSSTAMTEFVVASSEEMALAHVLNYPNPFTTNTAFFFEHNRPCSTLDVQVQVFTVSGRLVKTLNRRLTCEGFRAEPMSWDGLDDYGDKLARGVYVYRLHVTAPDGAKAEKYEKLVILR